MWNEMEFRRFELKLVQQTDQILCVDFVPLFDNIDETLQTSDSKVNMKAMSECVQIWCLGWK